MKTKITTANPSMFCKGHLVGFSDSYVFKVVSIDGPELTVRTLYWFEKLWMWLKNKF